MKSILESPQLAAEALIAAFRGQGTATVHEALGQRGALDASVKPLDRKFSTSGPARTVYCPPGDNLMLIKAVSLAGPGEVLVLHSGGGLNHGPFGEVLAVECLARGVAGLVTDGSVRDSEAIIRLGFPVFAAGLSIRGTAKAALGLINHPLVCGGVLVRPGDIVLGDADGVVIVPPAEAESALAAARARTAREEEVLAQLRNGASLFDLYGYDKTLDHLEEDAGD